MKITHPTFKEFLNQILEKDPALKQEFEKPDLAFEIAKMFIEARLAKGLTQNELAKKVKTSQSSIARIEAGGHLPTLSFLERVAHALNT